MKNNTVIGTRLDIAFDNDIVVCKELPGEVCFFCSSVIEEGLVPYFIPSNEVKAFRDLFVELRDALNDESKWMDNKHFINTTGELYVTATGIRIKRKLTRDHHVIHFAAYDKPGKEYTSLDQLIKAVDLITKVLDHSVKLKSGKGDFDKLKEVMGEFEQDISKLSKTATLDISSQYFMSVDDASRRWDNIFRFDVGCVSNKPLINPYVGFYGYGCSHVSNDHDTVELLLEVLSGITENKSGNKHVCRHIDAIPYMTTSVYGYPHIHVVGGCQFTMTSSNHAEASFFSTRTHTDNVKVIVEKLKTL